MAQLDLDGREHAPTAASPVPCAPVRLFDAPTTIRGQMALQAPTHAPGVCPWCDRGAPAVHEWIEDDGGAGARLSCCANCWEEDGT